MTVSPVPVRPPIVGPLRDPAALAGLLGSTVPRIFTPPRWSGPPGPCGCGCALRPATSRGFEVISFAVDVLGVELLPWQRWWLIHALELSITVNPYTGRRPFRFRTLLTLVARQQGKSWLLRVVALWAMYVRGVPMVLGAAQSLDIARECWLGAVELAQSTPDLAAEIPAAGGVRYTNGEQCLSVLVDGGSLSRYRITAATRGAGRGLTVDVLLLDELREHRDHLAWAALSKTTLARPEALIIPVSNAGDDGSIVLNELRASALAAIERCAAELRGEDSDDLSLEPVDLTPSTAALLDAQGGPNGRARGGDGSAQLDPSGGIFLAEWSAPEGCALDDPTAWVAAMPGLNHYRRDGSCPITVEAVLGFLATDPPAVFRTELLCQRVGALDQAVDGPAWARQARSDPEGPEGSLAVVRERLAVCVDVAPEGAHVTACVAGVLPSGVARVEIIGAWDDLVAAEQALPAILELIGPAEIGWFPAAPVGSLGPVLRMLRRTVRRVIPRIERDARGVPRVVFDDESAAAKITAAMEREACQGFAELVKLGRLVHPGDPLLDRQTLAAGRVDVGGDGGWRMVRKGGGHVDATYAAAGAVYLARQLPEYADLPEPMIY